MAYNVKFLKGTLDSYNAIQLKDSNTFYYMNTFYQKFIEEFKGLGKSHKLPSFLEGRHKG